MGVAICNDTGIKAISNKNLLSASLLKGKCGLIQRAKVCAIL